MVTKEKINAIHELLEKQIISEEEYIGILSIMNDPELIEKLVEQNKLGKLIKILADYYRVEQKQIVSKERSPELIKIRQMGMYLAKELTGASDKVIGVKFGNYDCASVRYGIERLEVLIKEDLKIKKDVECLENIYLRKDENKPETFDFLGFTHYCSKSRNGNFRVKHKTANKKYWKKCKQMNITIRDMRFEKKKYIFTKVNQILTGYYHYYGISDNYQMMDNFRKRVIQILYFWMNRRSQRKSYTWDGFNQFLKVHPIVRPRIYVSLYG